MYFRRVFLLLLLTLQTAHSKETNVSNLKSILNYQFQDNDRIGFIENQVIDQSQQQTPTHSPWSTEITSSLELQNNTEEFPGQPTNRTKSIPFDTKVTQNTPYGLSLNLDYYKEMADPTFLNTFSQERYRGSLEFSLLRDPLGFKTRQVIKNFKDTKPLFKIKVESDQCRDIALKYNEAFAIQENIKVINDTLKNSESTLRGLKRAARTGAVNKTTVSVLEINTQNLKADKSNTEASLLTAIIELENLSGFTLRGSELTSVGKPNSNFSSEGKSALQIELLKQEIKTLKAQEFKMSLDRNHELSLYAGVNSSSFAQNIINIEGQADFGFVGLRANLRFSDNEFKNRKSRLKAQIAVKENELRIATNLLKTQQTSFLTSLKNFSQTHESLTQGLSKLSQTEKRSFKNFRNGKTTYNDYLTSQNEILRYKQSLIKAQENFWQSYFNFEHFNGNSNKLCMKESQK